jgi:hypothetical protein
MVKTKNSELSTQNYNTTKLNFCNETLIILSIFAKELIKPPKWNNVPLQKMWLQCY